MKSLSAYLTQNVILIAWLVALLAMFTSLSLSEVFNLVPCKLCWYQRIFLFSSAFALGAGEYLKNPRIYRYVLPLTITGGTIALYHTLLQWGFVPEGSLTCSAETSCALKQFEWLGFVTIPFLSFLVFVTLTALMIFLRKQQAAEPPSTLSKQDVGALEL